MRESLRALGETPCSQAFSVFCCQTGADGLLLQCLLKHPDEQIAVDLLLQADLQHPLGGELEPGEFIRVGSKAGCFDVDMVLEGDEPHKFVAAIIAWQFGPQFFVHGKGRCGQDAFSDLQEQEGDAFREFLQIGFDFCVRFVFLLSLFTIPPCGVSLINCLSAESCRD